MDDCIHGSKEEPHVMVVHDKHYDLHILEEDQSFEFPLRERHTFMEEEEKNTIFKLAYGGIHASTCSMDENCEENMGMI